MTQHAWLDPSPFFFEGGPVGCLLIHGFTGAPPEMRPMGEFLAARGLTVLGPRLPGHGTSVEDLKLARWTDWAAEAERGLSQLKERCSAVFVGGLSMGGLLTLYLGQRHEVAGLIPMAAAVRTSMHLLPLIPVARHFVDDMEKGPPSEGDYVDPGTYERCWSYDVWPVPAAYEFYKLMQHVRRRLWRIQAPILIIQGEQDDLVPPSTARLIYYLVRSRDKQVLMLPNSGHCVTVDAAREMVWEKSYEFIRARLEGQGG